jgi:Uma2 family endonuclease
VRTIVPDPPPAEFAAWLQRRRERGLDRFDEVWDGEYVVMPSPGHVHALLDQQIAELLGPLARRAGLIATDGLNLGERDQDYRIPDRVVCRPEDLSDWLPTAELVVEIVSPGDQTERKLPHYAAHGVKEVVIVDPGTRSVRWLALREGEYRPVQRSAVIDLAPDQLAAAVDWPALD